MGWTGKKMLVTGACGFIGSHLCEELVRLGAEVSAFVHYNSRNHWGALEDLSDGIRSHLRVLPGDIQDSLTVRRAVKGQEVVFHLAALIGIPYSYLAPEAYVNTNIRGTLNVLQSCLEEQVTRVIHTSTSEVYGTARYTPIDESHPLQAQSPYAASKIAADKLAESYFCSFRLPVATLRPFNTFGPRQSARAVIPTIISQVLSGRPIQLGSLDPVRDLTFVKDTVMGFIRIADQDDCVGEAVNLGRGEGITIGDLARRICALIGESPELQARCEERVRPPASEVQKLIADTSKARRLLDWQPRVSVEKGLAETIRWMEAHLPRYKTGVYNV